MFRVSCIQLCSNNNVEHNLKGLRSLILKLLNKRTDFILTPEVSSKISLNKKKLLNQPPQWIKIFILNEIKF